MTLCACGCGEPTTVYFGKVRKFRQGHGIRVGLGPGDQSGDRHPRWRGGRTKRPDGYVSVKMPSHPNARKSGYVYEHVLVASRALGKPLPRGAIVHHVNGNEGDNRPCNLVICQDHSYHQLLHRRAKALAACGNPNALKCMRCGSYDDQDDMAVTGIQRRRSQHRHCETKYRESRKGHR